MRAGEGRSEVTRIVDGHIEVYFHQHNSGTGRADVELVVGLEFFLLLADEAKSIEALRANLITEATRVSVPRFAAAAVGAR